MMSENNTIHDTPEGWERYAEILRNVPPHAMDQRRSAEMLTEIATRTSGGSRPLRWMQLLGAGGLATAVVAVMLAVGIGPFDRLSLVERDSTPVVIRAATGGERRTVHLQRRTLPRISTTDFPSIVDTALPRNPANMKSIHPVIPPLPPATTGGPRNGSAGR
jgi:hypothetical protein